MSLLLLLAAQSLPTRPEPVLHLHNPSPLPQQCLLTASLPLPRPWGARSLLELKVGEASADWAPLLRWADGTLAVVQLQWRASLAADETARVLVHCVPSPDDPRASAVSPQVASAPWSLDLPLHAEVVDPWGRVYVARLSAPDQTRRGAVQQLHWVAPHVHAATGVVFLTTEIYLTRAGDEPFGELTVLLSNARGGEPTPIGPTRLTRFSLITTDSQLRLRPHNGFDHLLPQPTMERGTDGVECGFRQDLLGPSEMLFLGDGTAKVFRFDVCFHAGLSALQLAAIDARMSAPPSAFADLEWVRFTGAFGLFGGPAPVVSAADDLAAQALTAWRNTAQFGPFGGFGNIKEAAAVGYAHNTPTSLHNVLRWRSSGLLRVAQARAMQAALRPLPGRQGPSLPASPTAEPPRPMRCTGSPAITDSRFQRWP